MPPTRTAARTRSRSPPARASNQYPASPPGPPTTAGTSPRTPPCRVPLRARSPAAVTTTPPPAPPPSKAAAARNTPRHNATDPSAASWGAGSFDWNAATDGPPRPDVAYRLLPRTPVVNRRLQILVHAPYPPARDLRYAELLRPHPDLHPPLLPRRDAIK